MIPHSDDVLLTRDAVSSALTAIGFPIAGPTLATKRLVAAARLSNALVVGRSTDGATQLLGQVPVSARAWAARPSPPIGEHRQYRQTVS
jgi:hypothetical protein